MGGISILWRRCHPIIMWGHGNREGLSSAFVLSALIAAALIICAFPDSTAASGDKPSWSAGDYWEYEGWNYPYVFKQRVEVKGEETLIQNGRSYSAFRLFYNTTLSLGSQVETYTYTQWYQSSDLSLIRLESNMSAINATATVTYDPPLPVFQFPMAVGETWTSSSNIVINKTCTNCTLIVPTNLNREITSIVDLTLTLDVSGQGQTRTFRTYVLKESWTTPGHYLSYYSDDVGFWVKREAFADNGTRLMDYSLTSFSYANAPSPPDVTVIVIVIVILATVILVTAILILRRRKMPNAPVDVVEGEPPT